MNEPYLYTKLCVHAAAMLYSNMSPSEVDKHPGNDPLTRQWHEQESSHCQGHFSKTSTKPNYEAKKSRRTNSGPARRPGSELFCGWQHYLHQRLPLRANRPHLDTLSGAAYGRRPAPRPCT